MANTSTAEKPAKVKAVKDPDAPKKPRLSAVERLAAQLEEARAKAAEKAESRIDKAKTEVEAATKDATRANARLDAARLALSELEKAAGHSSSNGAVEVEATA